MNALGIVVEYNPFHNGHKLHLEKTKEVDDEAVVIACMSGNFLQRGEPAIFDKWSRALMAQNNGVDIVIELPPYYSTQSAEKFAEGSIRLLGELEVSTVVFGSESGVTKGLLKIVETIESDEFEVELKKELDKGISYPNAMSMALETLTGENGILKPNDILGIEYIKACKNFFPNIEPRAIKREKVGYHSLEANGEIASATGIRKKIFENKKIDNLLPKKSYELIEELLKEDKKTFLKEFYPLIRYKIISSTPKELFKIKDIEVGLEYRILECAKKYHDFDKFYNNLMTKRYTNARIQRVLIHILLGITDNLTDSAYETIPYINVLAMSSKGRAYINSIKKDLKVPLLSGSKNIKEKLDSREKELYDHHLTSDRIYQIINYYEERKFPHIGK